MKSVGSDSSDFTVFKESQAYLEKAVNTVELQWCVIAGEQVCNSRLMTDDSVK